MIKFKNIICLFLVFLLLMPTFVFADETKISVFEGVIGKGENLQLITSSKTYDLFTEEKSMIEFMEIIANNGVKVKLEGKLKEDKKIDVTYVALTSTLPNSLEDAMNDFQLANGGKKTTFKEVKIISENNNLFIISGEEKYNVLSDDVNVLRGLRVIANSNLKMYLEGTMYTNHYMATYFEVMEEVPKELQEELSEIHKASVAERTKIGVIISEGKDAYLLVEKDTNKMYYLKTNDEIIRKFVPVVANSGQTMSVEYLEITGKDNMINVIGISCNGEVDEDLKKKFEALDKEIVESSIHYGEGYIVSEEVNGQTDYNFIYVMEDTKEEKKMGLIADHSDVVKVIKTLANDKDAKVKIEGYVNYEKTIFKVLRITLLTELPKETQEKLSIALNNNSSTQTNNTPTTNTQGTTNNSSSLFANFGNFSGFGNLGSLFGNTNNQGNNANNTQTNTNNSLLNNFGNFSSFFENFDMSNFGNFSGFGNMGSLFGDNTNTQGTTNNSSSLFANFGNFSGFGNLGSLFGDSTNGTNTTSPFSSLFANFGNFSGFGNLGSLFGNTNTQMNNTLSNGEELTETNVFAEN